MSPSSALVVVEASSRMGHLPAGRLTPLGAQPMLEVQLRRLAVLTKLTGATLVVTVSDAPTDDPTAQLAADLGWTVVRGAYDDQLGWLAIALARTGASRVAVVRDDAPLSDPYLVLAALGAVEAGADHAGNIASRTHPRGLEVEALSARAVRAMELELSDPAERARPTGLLLRNPERFALANLDSGHDLASEDWSARSARTFERAGAVLASVRHPLEATWAEMLSVAGRTHRPRPGEVQLRPQPSAAPGSAPWVRRWTATVDGIEVGEAVLTVAAGRSERWVDVPEAHLESVREALYRLLLGDLQVAPPAP